MFTNDEASKDALMDATLEEMLQDTSLEEDVDDEFDDDDDDIDLQADLINADLNQHVAIPAEVSEYIIALESQTQQLEKELEECDELLMYLPHQTKGNRQAVVLYEDSRQLEEAAAEHGLSVEELKQKVLRELDQEHFTAEDVKREFEEFSRLKEELNEMRSAFRLGTSNEVKAILPREDATEEGGDNSCISEETTLALCNIDAGSDANGSHVLAGYTISSCTDEHFEVGPLVSSTALSDMRDYVLEQLKTTEQHHEIRAQTLTKSIEKCKQEEEAILLNQEERRKILQAEHNTEEAAMLKRWKENERLVEEEQKVKKEQTTQELNLIQADIDQLSEALEKEKQLYEVSCKEWIEQLDAARQQAAIRIQKVYRGYRARRRNSSTIEELKDWKELKKEERYKLRIMEVEYEIRYQEEQVQKEKDKEMEAAEKKMKEEEEERRKENERMRKEEENRIVEELRKEKERKNEELRLAEERRRMEEEVLRKQAELRCKEEERLRKEEEKQRKNDEKKKQKEEEKRKKEEKRKIKDEEKRRKHEEKQVKEEEITTREEEKNMLKEEERIEKGKEEEIKEEVKINLKEKMNIQEETIRKENKEVKETYKRSEEEMHRNNATVIDKERKGNSLEESTKDTIVQQAEEKGTKDMKEEIRKEDLSETTKIESETNKTKFDNLSSNDGIVDLLHQAGKPALASKNVKSDISCTDGKPDISCKDETTAMSLVYGSTVSQLLSPPSVSMKTDSPPLHSHAKARADAKSESILVQQLSASVTSSALFQEATGANLRLPSTESQVIHQKRLNWMKACIPWSKISCEPWKLKQTSQKSYKRPTRAKKLSPVSEAVVLDRAHAASLREVTSVTLTSLPECSLSTLGQCWSLQYLTVTGCGLMCLEGLGQCKHLLYINAENNNIEYMDLKDLGSLQVVRLAHNSLSAIHGLDGCINLRSLDLSHNRITRISGLGSLRRVHTLNLSHNQLVSSGGLEEAITLQHLDLSNNYLQHVANISKLCLLSDLRVACNNLLQVPELQNQVLLQTLHLQENSIKSLEPVGQYWLPLLHTLNCSQNLLESVTGISCLVLLSHLDVSQNQITDMENLLPGIAQNKRLESLMLEGNPLVDAYTQEYKQLTIKAVPSLKSLNHLSVLESSLKSLNHLTVQTQAAESDVDAGADLCDDFIQMCLSQASLHTALKDEFHSQMRVLLVNQHVTGEILCSTCFTFCDTSFKMASEHRLAHEYGDTSTTNDINHSSVFMINEKAKFNSITYSKPQPETMVDRKHVFNVSGSYNTSDKSASDTDSVNNVCDKKVNSAAILDKENCASDNQSIVIKSSNSGTGMSHISSVTKDKHSDLTQTNMQPDCQVSNNVNSTTRQSQNNMNSSLDATEIDKTTSQSTEVEFSLSERSNSNRNNSRSNTIYQPSANGSSIEGMNRLALASKTNLANSVQDNNFTVKAKPTSVNLHNHDHFGQYLSGKDKFEMALQAQSSTSKVMADVQMQNNANIYQSTNGSGHMLLSGVKANIVGGRLFQQDTSDISKDLELSAHDSDGNVDMDSMEFDIDSFLDMGELDELLELGWRPADAPDIPKSMHPILGKINAADSHIVNMGKQKITSQNHILPHPPSQPSHAWTHSPVSTEFKSSGQTLAHETASPITAPSPLSVASTAETVSRGSVKSKKEELSEEWGFKDSRTVEMMLARAKKMKYNSERRRKLDKLDPQQKLHLLKKLEDKYRIKTTRSPSAKVLPRKEYFQAREEELHRQELEKQTEDSTRFHRMFEWLHTQVGDYNISGSRLNPGVSSGYFNQDKTSSTSKIMGHIHARKSSPLSDHHKPVGRDAQQIRRYSNEETKSGHSSILPPIHENSLPSGNKKDRISFRDTPVETSGGWGGGKKRGKIKS